MSLEVLDPTFDPTAWQPARRRRMLLVAYIDYLLFTAPWALLVFGLQHLDIVASLPSLTKWVVFGILEWILLSRFQASPGARLLGIRFVPVRDHASPIDKLWQGNVPMVSRELHERESWFTMLLATLALNEGCKSLVRWTMWNPPIPFFGHPTDETTAAFIYLVSGAIEIYLAVLLYRVDIRAFFIGVSYIVLQLASTILSWDLWDGWAAEMTRRRRAYQGVPVREGEIEFIQSITPELMVGTLVFSIVLLLLAVPRLKAARARNL